MKIKSIEFINHPILGNIYLDFMGEDGNPVDTIILAGENGSGKSTILDLIFKTATSFYHYDSFYEDDVNQSQQSSVSMVVTLTYDDWNILRSWLSQEKPPIEILNYADIKLQHVRKGENNYERKAIIEGVEIDLNKYQHLFNPFLRCIFSDVEINFTPQHVSGITTKNLDEKIQGGIRSNSSLATEISQLLVDIQTLDDADVGSWVRENPDKAPDPSMVSRRTKRFRNAFHLIFPSKKYKGVANTRSAKRIIFEENGKEIPVERLSSGEKQIVFRGSFLLKDQQSTKGIVVLLDEPELSLHPTWQTKVLEFYKSLFRDESGQQTSQIFVATHSPFIIHNDNRLDDKVIVLAKNSQGEVYVKQEPEFFGWIPNKIVEQAFNLNAFTNLSLPTIYVEGSHDVRYLKKAAEYLGKTQFLSKFQIVDADGAANLDKIWQIRANISKALNQNIMLLYDCDVDKKQSEDSGVYKRIIPKIETHHIKKGIENLFSNSLIEKAMLHKEAFIDVHESTRRVRGTSKTHIDYEVNKDEKKNLCDWICENATADDFSEFHIVFKIIEILLPIEFNLDLESIVR
jgi:predicted ATPase